MHIALEISHRDRIAGAGRTQELAVLKAVLLPYRASVAAVQGMQGAAVVAHEGVARVEAQPGKRGQLAPPDLAAALRLVAGDPALVGRGADLAPLHCRL